MLSSAPLQRPRVTWNASRYLLLGVFLTFEIYSWQGEV